MRDPSAPFLHGVGKVRREAVQTELGLLIVTRGWAGALSGPPLPSPISQYSPD